MLFLRLDNTKPFAPVPNACILLALVGKYKALLVVAPLADNDKPTFVDVVPVLVTEIRPPVTVLLAFAFAPLIAICKPSASFTAVEVEVSFSKSPVVTLLEFIAKPIPVVKLLVFIVFAVVVVAELFIVTPSEKTNAL